MTRRASVLALLALASSGCFLARARSNTNFLETIASVRGTLTGPDEGKPLFVVLYKMTDHGWGLFSHRLLYQSGSFEFSCIAGRYALVAFEDQNEDLVWQPTEPGARFGPRDGLEVEAGKTLEGLDLEMGSLQEPVGFEVSVSLDALNQVVSAEKDKDPLKLTPSLRVKFFEALKTLINICTVVTVFCCSTISLFSVNLLIVSSS